MKKNIRRGILFLLFFLFFSNQILYAKKTVYAGFYENPPLSYIDKNDNANGLFPNILNIIAQKNHLGIIYKKCLWPNCLNMLSNGKIDILFPIAKTKSREKKYLFSNENILTNYGTIYTQKDAKINFWTDLNDKKIGLLKDDIYATLFWDYIKKFKINTSVVYFKSYKKMFELLNQKKLDAIVSNSIIFLHYKQKFPNIKKTDIIVSEVPITFAFSKNKQWLKHTIDKSLKNYKIDINSEYFKILHRYLDIKVKSSSKYLKYFLITVITLVILIISLLILNRWLHKMIKKATSTIEKKYQKELYLNKIINTVKSVNQILLENISMHNKLSEICQKIVEEELYEASCIAIPDKKNLHIAVSSKNSPKNYITDIDTEQADKDNSIVNFLKENTITITKFSENDFFLKKYTDKENLTYVLRAPIKTKEKKDPVGILIVYTSKRYGFRKKEISLIEELAGDIALCMSIEHLKEKNLQFLTERVNNYKEMVYALNKAIEARDPYTAGHNSRVSEYATLIAKHMGLSSNQIKDLQKAGELHDIGKIETPDSILLKPGALNSFEYDIIKMHPKKGYEILSNITLLKNVSQIILYHHERYDGSGYPFGLKKDEIPLLSQILSIADTFDAMTTNRIYKLAKSKSDALKEIKSLSNIWFSDKLAYHTLEALSNITIKNSNVFNQILKDPLTDARFAYFFKDHLTECYNNEYLKHLYIIKEIFNFSYLQTLAIKNFTNFNRQYSWEKGDKLLQKISTMLQKKHKNSKIFRVKGDDFIIVSQEKVNALSQELLDIFDKYNIIRWHTKTYKIDEINTLKKLKILVRDI